MSVSVDAIDVTRTPVRTFKRSSIQSGLGTGNSKYAREVVVGSGDDAYIHTVTYSIGEGKTREEIEFIRVYEDILPGYDYFTTDEMMAYTRSNSGHKFQHISGDNWMLVGVDHNT